MAAAKAKSTRRAYRANWADFETWCATEGFTLPTPPAMVAAYAADLAWPSDERAGLAPATIGRRLAAIAHEHRRAGADDVQERPEGLLPPVRRSKSDQEGKGRHVEIVFGTNDGRLVAFAPHRAR